MIGITALYVSMLYLVLHRHVVAFALLSTTALAAIVLYFTWYQHLPAPGSSSEEFDPDRAEVSFDSAESVLVGGSREV